MRALRHILVIHYFGSKILYSLLGEALLGRLSTKGGRKEKRGGRKEERERGREGSKEGREVGEKR